MQALPHDALSALVASLGPSLELSLLAGAVAMALGVDWLLGEPPTRWHPVVGMGCYLDTVGSRVAPLCGAPMRRWAEFGGGFAAWCLGAFLVAGLAFALEALLGKVLTLGLASAFKPSWALVGLHALLTGLVLKPMLSWRLLHDEVRAVETALSTSVAQGRARLAWLVSRDVSTLDETQVREAALSTLAENLNDSVVAPLFWFVVAGLPGAAVYRFANTADAMWGYRGEHQGRTWTWAGQWAARVDDVLSWLPARLTAAVLGCVMWRTTQRGYWPHVARQSRLTPSPNSGWPMAALACGMGLSLCKVGHYQLNPQGRPAQASDTPAALRTCACVVGLLAGLAGLSALTGVLFANV